MEILAGKNQEKSCIRADQDLVYLEVKALPNASRSQVLDVKDGRLRVKIAAAPEDGKANAELCSVLAKLLGCPRKGVSLKAGEKSRLKTLAFPIALKAKLETFLRDGLK
jgi:uncharacterized protein (TIGR00251 family)